MQELRENKSFCLLYLTVVAIVVTNVVGSGCQQLGVAHLTNPLAGPVPQYKSQYGPTPVQRMEGLSQLASRARDLPLAEAERTVKELSEAYADETDPNLRRSIVSALAHLDGAEPTVRRALSDADSSVREAACQALACQDSATTAATLHECLLSDADADVRCAAIRALTKCSAAESVQYLATALDDHDPALQVAAMDALRTRVGKDFGHNVHRWRKYVASHGVHSDPVSAPPVEAAP